MTSTVRNTQHYDKWFIYAAARIEQCAVTAASCSKDKKLLFGCLSRGVVHIYVNTYVVHMTADVMTDLERSEDKTL